ncbi:unnamed protein product [Cladocopium goreaui]|uniref:Nipped-B-like protein B n=1 Tax=Cladocopium goreaui TaxID=2562237 RepID=A0A9P1DB04_9DINO|nr:unnamed protein product [Cladocopium goreaui]|mmetsp:Transcript_1186/g.2656  ORF Transcript_1186/g.2656 Transcript_1186/m.2656 type:complete len:227 (-) Transcript_1186:56-736(-)
MLSTETNQCGLTGQMPSSTKPHVYIFGGHSGKGMCMATEIATSDRTCAVTTISKRGKPSAPGPASAFAQAMAQSTVHYMAACDEKDVKAVECLMDWTAPSMQPLPEARFNVTDVMEQVKKEIGEMNQEQLNRALATVIGQSNAMKKNQRQIKTRLDHKQCSEQEKNRLQDMLLDLQEKEACFLELQTDVKQKLGEEAPPASAEQAVCHVDTLLKQMEKELALQKSG